MSAVQNPSENKYKNAPVTTFELCLVREGVAVWELNNWKVPSSFDVMKKLANCVVRLSDDRVFCFFFKDQKILDPTHTPQHCVPDSIVEVEIVSLFVRELTNKPRICQTDERFNLKVLIQHLNGDMQPKQGPAGYMTSQTNGQQWTSICFDKLGEERVVIEQFIILSSTRKPNPVRYGTHPTAMAEAEVLFKTRYPPTIYNRPTDLRYGITVQLFSVDAPSSAKSCEKVEFDVEPGIGVDFQRMYDQDDNHSDIKLESKDGMVINAHKFVLAARSSKFKALLEEQTKRNDYSGAIKIGDVNAKPLMAILKWKYTGKLDDNQVGREEVLEELIIAGGDYELEALLKLCEKKLTTVCNPMNMLNFFQLAQKHRMQDAVKEISLFIKENIDGAISHIQV